MSHDRRLQQAVLDELSWEPSVTAAHIGVTASAGVVTLTGHVESFAEKHAAEEAARRVKGVKAVAAEIEVRLPFERQRGDDDIAAAALERLAWDSSVPHGAFQVVVEKGWLTLTGQADWFFQKDAAEQDVRRLFGIVGVSNRIVLRPRVDIANLRDEITHAMHRSWYFDNDNVKVSADGGRIRLTGTVNSLGDRDTAAATAWAAPGAISVENDILVS